MATIPMVQWTRDPDPGAACYYLVWWGAGLDAASPTALVRQAGAQWSWTVVFADGAMLEGMTGTQRAACRAAEGQLQRVYPHVVSQACVALQRAQHTTGHSHHAISVARRTRAARHSQ